MASYVYVKNPNGTTYVYENISYWNRDTKRTEHIRKCIGHIDDETGDIVPNGKRGRAKASVSPINSQKPEKPQKQCDVFGCGISLLFGKAASQIKLDKVLKKVFPSDWQAIMTCAYYLVSEGNALSRAEQWTEQNITPYANVLANQRISELLKRITPQLSQEFFSEWMRVNHCDEYYCMDITSVSSYSELVDFVEYGYNRDREKLPQINLLMITGQTSHLPLYYRIIPGSINDVSTMNDNLAQIDMISAKKIHLVTDKGFYSEDNIDAFYRKGMKFSVGVPFTSSLALNAVEKYRIESITDHEHLINVLGDEIYCATELLNWKGHRCYRHVYYDSLKAAHESKKFDHYILMLHDELVSGKTVKSHQIDYNRYFIVKETPKRGRKVMYNKEAINAKKITTAGWFVMISNDIKDPAKALEVYRLKDAAEKNFDDLKNDLDMKRLRVHSTAAMEGRIFIQYIALTLLSYLREKLNANEWFKRNSDMQTLIDSMKSLRVIITEGKRRPQYTTPTRKQQIIMDMFNIVL